MGELNPLEKTSFSRENIIQYEMCDNEEEMPRELPSPWVPVQREFQTNSTVDDVKEKSPVKENEAINIDLRSELENSRMEYHQSS